jgi:hypothetical protein
MGDLLNHCQRHSPDFNILDVACLKLAPYITVTRYPTGIDITESHMKQALKHAKEILDFTMSKLKELGYEYNPG